MLTWESKFPGEDIVYGLEWAPSLSEGDTIVSTDVAAPGGFVIANPNSFLGTLQSIKVSGGTPGIRYILLTAITAANETLQEIVRINVKTAPA